MNQIRLALGPTEQRVIVILDSRKEGISNFQEDMREQLIPAISAAVGNDDSRLSLLSIGDDFKKMSYWDDGTDLPHEMPLSSFVEDQVHRDPIIIWTDMGLIKSPKTSRKDSLMHQLVRSLTGGQNLNFIQWKKVLGHLSHNGAPIVVVTPVPSEMIPHELKQLATFISLDSPEPAGKLPASNALVVLKEPAMPVPALKTQPLDLMQVRAKQVFDLAMLSTLAGRVEPQLLRELRMNLVPDGRAIDEALLQDSFLAKGGGPTGFSHSPEYRDQFRQALIKDRRLDAAWSTIYELRTGLPWADRAKQELTTWLLTYEELSYWGLRGVPSHGPTRARIEGICSAGGQLERMRQSEREIEPAVVWV